MSKIAVLYTGEIRTIEKTSPFFRRNILDPTHADIFATIQGCIMCQTFERILSESWRDNLKSFSWFSRDQYNALQDELISKMDLEPRWKSYLKTSGSMIEYYQLYLSFQKMREYEEEHHFRYDYVVRLRTDVVVTRPLDFSWFEMPPSRLRERWEQVGESFPRFMNSFFSLERVLSNDVLEMSAHLKTPSPTTIEGVQQYMEKGRFLLTIRKNVFYVGKRDVFETISRLGMTYGQWKCPQFEHWFDAESQLESICEQSGIDTFDSMTRLEGESLYRYKTENYFDEKGGLLSLPFVVCFICRCS
jgi:hypothetical protein